MAAGFLGHGAIRSVGSYRLGRKQGKPWNQIAWYKLTSKLNNHLPSLGQYKHLQYTPVRYFPQAPKTGVMESGAALVFHSQVQEQREKGFSKELQKQGIVFQVSALPGSLIFEAGLSSRVSQAQMSDLKGDFVLAQWGYTLETFVCLKCDGFLHQIQPKGNILIR